jgi:hypothetical protein
VDDALTAFRTQIFIFKKDALIVIVLFKVAVASLKAMQPLHVHVLYVKNGSITSNKQQVM